MANNANVKNLVKILIGAAWLDGEVQPEERQYLYQVAQEKNLADDPDIRPLLYELRTVQPTECYEWVKEYLGDRPSTENCYNLIEAISGLIYSDGEVATEEAKFLSKLQSLNSGSGFAQSGYAGVLKEIQKLYRKWVESRN
jgi:uncharacterized tellurite resistance protein B-like protein